MPFQSRAQQRYLFLKHPRIAERFAAETPDIKALPEKKADEKKGYALRKKRDGK